MSNFNLIPFGLVLRWKIKMAPKSYLKTEHSTTSLLAYLQISLNGFTGFRFENSFAATVQTQGNKTSLKSDCFLRSHLSKTSQTTRMFSKNILMWIYLEVSCTQSSVSLIASYFSSKRPRLFLVCTLHFSFAFSTCKIKTWNEKKNLALA